MVELVSDIVKCVVIGLLFFSGMAFAADDYVPDPTRPSSASAVAVGGSIGSGPVLQSVLISPGRRVAVISGQTVRVGDKVAEARVVRISETEVQLDDGKEIKILKLYPPIGKRIGYMPAHKAPVQR